MHAAEAVSSPLSSTRWWRCDRSSYKRSLVGMIRAGPSSSSLPHWVSFSLKPTTHHVRLVWIRTTAGMEASCFHLCNDASTPPVPGHQEVSL